VIGAFACLALIGGGFLLLLVDMFGELLIERSA
jgi:hypothetical protein